MRFAVLVFPGSNCDHDCYHTMKHVLGQEVDFIWHKEESFKERYDGVIIPGGFSYGDYLRTGAIARFSPVMKAVEGFAKGGGLVIGICNGFQILLEAGLLPGAMLRNESLKFICKDIYVKVENEQTPFTRCCNKADVLRLPIAHAEGNYFADDETLARLEENGQVVLQVLRQGREHHPGGEPERFRAQHRGHMQRKQERHGPDAAPGTRVRGDTRQYRRQKYSRIHALARGDIQDFVQAAGLRSD